MSFSSLPLSLWTVILLLLPAFSHASSIHHNPRRTHQGISKANLNTSLQKRETHSFSKRGGFSGKATFYATGLGACGKTNTDSDFIVALNQPQYEANKWCFKSITVSYGGKSHEAQIVDECPGCPYGGLDMSPALFKYFASEDAGIFYMTWTLNDGGGSADYSGGSAKKDDDKPKTPDPPAYVPPPPPPTPPTPPTPTHSDPPPAKQSDTSSKAYTPPAPVAQSATSNATNVTANPFQSVNFTQTSLNTTVHKSTTVSYTNPPPSTAALTKGYSISSSQYGSVETADAYATGGNLDVVSQLVVCFGSLTTASASHAISN